jgi:predicted transcriptional regulator
MIKTTVYFDEDLALALRQLAGVQGRSQADLIRLAVTRYVDQASHPLPRGIGAYDSGRSDVSARAEELLEKAVEEREWP